MHVHNRQALALEFGERLDSSTDGGGGGGSSEALAVPDSTFYEITIATVDQPKLLSRLSDAMVRAAASQQLPGPAASSCGGPCTRPWSARPASPNAPLRMHASACSIAGMLADAGRPRNLSAMLFPG
jgi:hypothetical protein